MAERAVRIRYIADTASVKRGAKDIDDAQNRIGRSIKASSVAIAAAGAVIGAVVLKVATDSVRAFHEAEEVQAGLQDALRRTGQGSAAVAQAFEDQQKQLQALTTFDDEAIASAQTMATVFGLTADQVQRVTPAVLDLATVLRVDVAGAQKMLDLALAGNLRALKQLGIEGFDPTGNRAADLTTLLGLLRPKIEGAAEAAAKTSAGGLKQMRVALENIQEAVGAVIMRNVIPSFIAGLFGVDVKSGNLAQTMNELAPRIEAAGASIGNAARTIGTLINRVGQLVGWLNNLGNTKAFAFLFGGGQAGAGPDILGRTIEKIVGKQVFMRNSVETATKAVTDQSNTFVAGLDPLETYGEAIEDTGKKQKEVKEKLSEATKEAARFGEAIISAFEAATGASAAYESIVVPDLEGTTKAWEDAVAAVEDAHHRLMDAMSPATADDLTSAELDARDASIALEKAQEKLAETLGDSEATARDAEEAQIAVSRAALRLRRENEALQEVQRKGTDVDADVVEAKDAVRAASEKLNLATMDLQHAQAGITPELLLDALREQERGAQQWASSLQALSHAGIDQGILKELARLGPEGLPKVQAFFDFVSVYGSAALNGIVGGTRSALDRAIAVFPEVRPAMEAVARDTMAAVGTTGGAAMAKSMEDQIKASVADIFTTFADIKGFVAGVPGMFTGSPAGWQLPNTGQVEMLTRRLGRQRGGPVTAGMPYIVGERGPEWFVPGRSGTVIPGGGVTIIVQGSVIAERDLAETVQKALVDVGRRGG